MTGVEALSQCIFAAYQTLHDLADAYAEGDEERVEILLYEIYCDYHISYIKEVQQ